MRYVVESALYGWEVVDLDDRDRPRRCQTLDEAYTLVNALNARHPGLQGPVDYVLTTRGSRYLRQTGDGYASAEWD